MHSSVQVEMLTRKMLIVRPGGCSILGAGSAGGGGIGGRRLAAGSRELAIKMCRWLSKGDFTRFEGQLFLRPYSKSRKYDFCGRAVLAFRSKLWGGFEHQSIASRENCCLL